MSTTFPLSPRPLKGAIVAFDIGNPVASIIPFQYNPTTLTRSLQAKTLEFKQDNKDALKTKGAPTETISCDIELDAIDGLEKQNETALIGGVHAQLAALEMLLYPKSRQVIAAAVQRNAGSINIAPPERPFTLFIWGAKRILPVNITDLSITEEAYDTRLNPIRAKVSLSMNVLSYNDLPMGSLGANMFIVHQVAKETLATLGSLKGLSQLSRVAGVQIGNV